MSKTLQGFIMFGKIAVLSLLTVGETIRRLFCAIILGFTFVKLKKKKGG